ncbi:pentatricopeptide repeat-containing protein At4g02750-like [Selaginella moellendorffii]|uniref:pentatricopeptide repeat-containing protein At4g02750-like n=1 Tax=Selaginella moellendorffii TaxID=88036 RepID=UPI000D1CD4E2|nr:pentatricopeptide repeat-containing protein At4g02750-like [Selaginella moellendorffii]|eukprot:XP_024532112.1 pentatricopeptide repeat-containing protein At4g02750-like [Selaginella moellendorffii]
MPEHDLVALTSMLIVHIQSGDLEQAKAIFARMPDQDIISQTAMIQAFSQNGQLREVGSSSRRCPSRTSSCAQLFSPRMLRAAIWTEQNRCLTRCRSGTPLLDVSRRRLRSEQSLGASPQLGAHHGQYSQLGRIDEAEAVFDEVLVKDILAWNTMLEAYSQHGYIEELRNTFDAMPERNIVSWNIAVATARARRRSSKALLQHATAGLRFLDDHDRGLCPERVYETLSTPCHRCLPRCSHAGLFSRGLGYFRSMVFDFDVDPVREHYSCVVDILGRSGQLEEAEELLGSIPFELDAASWGALLGGCGIHRDVQRGERAAENALKLDPSEDGARMLLANIYKAVGRTQLHPISRPTKVLSVGLSPSRLSSRKSSTAVLYEPFSA